jgi:hypothetical protein
MVHGWAVVLMWVLRDVGLKWVLGCLISNDVLQTPSPVIIWVEGVRKWKAEIAGLRCVPSDGPSGMGRC